jgi:protein phosphatase
VEEEVRAGRMTPEQAANHPSKNVISRALGAEEGVEVDMKTLEVEDGTEFLLCTDGITRHVSDSELRQLLVLTDDLDDLCDQLKLRCFERGAEDNLTVVAVRVGTRITVGERHDDLEPTITPETQPIARLQPDGNQTVVGFTPESTLIAPSRVAFPGPGAQAQPVSASQAKLNVADPKMEKRGGGVMRFFLFVLVLALIAGAFYAGAKFRDRVPFLAAETKQSDPEPSNPVTPVEEPFVQFERARRSVDRDPHAWLDSDIGKELVASGIQNPLDSPNAEFLYLYGRANLLTGKTDEAAKAFDAAIAKAEGNTSPTIATVKNEATFGLAVISLRSPRERQKAIERFDEITKPPANQPGP